MSKSQEDQNNDNMKDTGSDSGYNTPIDPALRHTGMYEAGDGRTEAQPEGGSSNTGTEGAPNQGTEKR